MYLFILNLFLCIYYVSTINFYMNNVTEMKLKNSDKVVRSYFGYSLLLQRGAQPLVIVGSPKQSKVTGGAIFACDILNGKECVKYNIQNDNGGTFNGNFLGVAIDGGNNVGQPFVTCAPRSVLQKVGLYFLEGDCYYKFNSSSFDKKPVLFQPMKRKDIYDRVENELYYNFGFAQVGLDIFYDQDFVLLGGVGIKNWNGEIVKQSLRAIRNQKIIPGLDTPITPNIYGYMGYKVGKGKTSATSFIYGGAPRAHTLLGKVTLYDNNYKLYRTFEGEELGSYFGAAILTEDVNNDNSDDLFIGAPMTAGSSFDEGCVYYYKNTIGSSVKLLGPKKIGARFGSSIVALGDIDLDKYNDIAISAPYEDDGVGAVYIYMGGSEGIGATYSQRLSPFSFSITPMDIKGFGLGLSRGNDIDGNGHNDLAVGAYRSGHVFVIPTKSVIDFRTSLEPNVNFVNSTDTHLTIKYCVYYEARANILKSVIFEMKVTLDSRVKGPKTHMENIEALSNTTKCNQVNVIMEPMIVDIAPLQFSLRTDVIGNVFAQGTSLIEKSVPYVHGCGDDNVCQTQILITVLTDTDSIVLGLNKAINANISAENVGEPGYQCKLFIEMTKGLELRQEKTCYFENSTYICPFATKLINKKQVTVSFDVTSKSESTYYSITFQVKCLGENVDEKETKIINVDIINSPYIEGDSQPENYEYNDETEEDTEVEIHHSFTLGNFGPSPVKSDINILLPIVKIKDEDIFKFIEAKASLRNIQVPCYPANSTNVYEKVYNVSKIVKAALSRVTVLDCFEEDSTCMELVCSGDYLYKSSESARYSLKFKTTTNMLAKFFQNQPQDKNILAYISSAILFNGTRVEGHAATLLLFAHSTTVPLWIYIISAVIGILLLGIVIFACYKCHFFDRRYREKMNDERLMDGHLEMEEDNSNATDNKPNEQFE